ncbi:MAG: DUF11 domain-containing protein, partial [Candidatus Acetothermia bacterium]|nr:DUF11 domain-containing protein [Candidatus Acetothermia bacterium]
VACTGLENRLDARFGCDDGSVCYDTALQGGTARASIRLLLGQPLLEITPAEIRVPYCNPAGATATIPIWNSGDGNAREVRICADFSPFTVASVVEPATYEGGCFRIPDLAPEEAFELQFNLVYFGDWCTAPERRDVFYQPVYRNDCGEEFLPPVGFFSTCFTCYAPDGPPTLSLSLTGLREVHICQDVAYQVTAGFSGLSSCGGGSQTDITVVVTVPAGFTVEDAGGGLWTPGSGGTGGTITWTFPPGSSLDTPIVLRPPGASRCGTLATLSATASATDCCGCPLSASQSVPIAIECRTLVGSTKVAVPPAQEKCGRITYTNTYTFADSALLDEVSFDELAFEESAANSQAYVPGSLAITVDGNPASPLLFVDTTPGGTLEIRGIDYPGSVRNTVLVISYTLEITPAAQPQACPGSYGFYSWSTLNLGPDCRDEDECTEYCTKAEALWVTAETPSMEVGLSGLPDLADPCGTYTVTLTLTKTSTYDPHDVVLQLENLNYYIVDLASVACSGDVAPENCTPLDYGSYYEWTYGEAFAQKPAGARSVLTFQVRKRCGPGLALSAAALYQDACGGGCQASAADAPLLLRSPNLFVYKTPEVYYATTNTQLWTIYLVNSGSGWAYDVWVDDILGSGLAYVSSSVAPATGVTTYPNEDHLGNPVNGVSWRIAAMYPGEQRVITLTTRLVSCSDLWNEVWTSLGCGGEDCLPPVGDSSTVRIPTTQLAATSSTASPIA